VSIVSIMFIKRLSGAALGAAGAIGLGLSVLPAQAGYVVTLTQQGSDVVANGSGPIDVTDLGRNCNSGFGLHALLIPGEAVILTGAPSGGDCYAGVFSKISAPANFGGGEGADASSGSGDIVGFLSFRGIGPQLNVPTGYTSNSPLSDTATYDNQTFASLGVSPGVYEWKWGTGPNQNFILKAGTVPEPSTWAMMLLGFVGLGFAGYRASRKSVALAA
jgi:PEP-CTERM motif